MSDEEIARLLRGLKSAPPKDRDEQEVAGYADLIGRIFDHSTELKLTENNIVYFHSLMFKASPPYLVKPEMEAAISWASAALDSRELLPIRVIAKFIFPCRFPFSRRCRLRYFLKVG